MNKHPDLPWGRRLGERYRPPSGLLDLKRSLRGGWDHPWLIGFTVAVLAKIIRGVE